MAAQNNLHRLIFILLALAANFLLYCVFSTMVGISADKAAELAAVVAFGLTAVASFAFKSFLEG